MQEQKIERPLTEIRLEKAAIDFGCVQTQMVLGLAAILLACFAGYWKSLNCGFLLDDFLHLDYCARFMSGDGGDFFRNLSGNWADSDVMKSYRPVVSMSVLIDYMLWNTNAVGYHVTNVLLLFGCSAALSLITLELTGIWNNRLGAAPALWAGLLFAVYPLHPEAVSWIIGRVDLLSCFFTLGSVYTYMRFRLLRERPYLIASLASFILGMASKEMAVILPVVLTLLEAFVYSKAYAPSGNTTPLKQAVRLLAPFYLTLAVFGAVRTALIGAFVGGYYSSGLVETLKSMRIFFDRETLMKIILPVNEEVSLPGWLKQALIPCYAAILASGALRIAAGWARAGAIVASFLWIGAAVLPTFQIWHIYPNLVGSRLFFLGSAPLCICLALIALPGADTVRRVAARPLALSGSLALFAVFIMWSFILQANQDPFVNAGKQMVSLRHQANEIAGSTEPGKVALLLDLPTDYSGAGMLTRPQYLNIIVRQPFGQSDLSRRLVTVEPPGLGSHEFIWPQQLEEMISRKEVQSIYIWKAREAKFIPWTPTAGRGHYEFKGGSAPVGELTTEPAQVVRGRDDSWREMSSSTPCLISGRAGITVHPGSKGVTVWLPDSQVDPLVARLASVDLDIQSEGECAECLSHNVQFVWRTESSPQAGEVALGDRYRHQYLLWLGRYRKWTLSGKVTGIGLRFAPGNYTATLKSVRLDSDKDMVPRLSLEGVSDPHSRWLKTVSEGSLSLSADASRLADVHFLKLLITPANTTCDAGSAREVTAAYPAVQQSPPQAQLEATGNRATFKLPAAVLSSAGTHQARLIASDALGMPVGLPSEPVSFLVPRK